MTFVATVSSVAPLLVGHLIVPLLNEPAYPPPWRSLIPALNVSAEGLCFTCERLEGGRWWTMLTSIFVHQDEAHALSNMVALMQSSNRVAGSFGPIGVWAIFFGGHIVNCLSVRITRFEFVEKQKHAMSFAATSPLAVLNSSMNALTNFFAPRAHRYVLYAGSSCGVSALRGASLVLAAKDMLDPRPFVRLRAGIDMAFTIGFIIGEWELFADHNDNISHAGHVIGFVTGGLAALALCAAKHIGRRRHLRHSRYGEEEGDDG